MQAKRDQIAQRLQKRAEALQAKRNQIKDDSKVIVHEQDEVFTNNFNLAHQHIISLLDECSSLEKESLSNHFESISQEFTKLQKFLSDFTPYLSSYKIRTAQDTLSSIKDSILSAQVKYMPKRKFAFKSKMHNEDTSSKIKDVLDGSAININTKGFSNKLEHSKYKENDLEQRVEIKENAIIKMLPEEVNKRDLTFSWLKKCHVTVYGSPNTVHLSNLTECRVLLGPVSTSIFVEDCTNCTFAVACQQLRVHTTSSSNFYLHVTSQAIIENCIDLGFAPYNWSYPELQAHVDMSGLDWTKNNWDSVQDFNWLSQSEPSPNWKIVDPSERIKSWDYSQFTNMV